MLGGRIGVAVVTCSSSAYDPNDIGMPRSPPHAAAFSLVRDAMATHSADGAVFMASNTDSAIDAVPTARVRDSSITRRSTRDLEHGPRA